METTTIDTDAPAEFTEAAVATETMFEAALENGKPPAALEALRAHRQRKALDAEMTYRNWVRRMASKDYPDDHDVAEFEHIVTGSGFSPSDEQIAEDLIAERAIQEEQRQHEQRLARRAELRAERIRRLQGAACPDRGLIDQGLAAALLRLTIEPSRRMALSVGDITMDWLTSRGCRKPAGAGGWVSAQGVPIVVEVEIHQHFERAFEPLKAAIEAWQQISDIGDDVSDAELREEVDSLPAADPATCARMGVVIQAHDLWIRPVAGEQRVETQKGLEGAMVTLHPELLSRLGRR